MSHTLSEAERIAREMQQVRADLRDDVRHLVSQARTLADWRHYVRSYPWVCLGAATAVGFLAIPAKKKVLQLDAAGVRELAGQQQLVVRVADDTKPRPSGLLAMVAEMAARSLMNGGLALVTQHLSQLRGTSPPQTARELQ